MKDDKIFNNNYGEREYTNENIKFTLSPDYEDDFDPDDKIHYDFLFEKVDVLIQNSQFKNLNKQTEEGVIKKLNKVQINEVFFYIISNVDSSYSKIDIFGVLSDYFDVFPNKFYNSLSNKFKDELINELDKKYDILKRKKINKLF